jgi:hypothetical protein
LIGVRYFTGIEGVSFCDLKKKLIISQGQISYCVSFIPLAVDDEMAITAHRQSS